MWDINIIEVFFSFFPNYNQVFGEKKNTALHYAVFHDNTEVMQFLFEKGVELSPKTKYGARPIDTAVGCGKLNALEKLSQKVDIKERYDDCIDASIKIKATEMPQYTLLHLAAILGQPEAIAWLLKKGFTLSERGAAQETPLISFIAHGETCSAEVLRLLIDQDSIDQSNDKGNTALHFAALFGYLEAAKILIESGADVKTINANRQTALHTVFIGIEKADNRKKIAQLLIDKGASPFAQDVQRKSPLQYGILRSDLDVSCLYANHIKIFTDISKVFSSLCDLKKLKDNASFPQIASIYEEKLQQFHLPSFLEILEIQCKYLINLYQSKKISWTQEEKINSIIRGECFAEAFSKNKKHLYPFVEATHFVAFFPYLSNVLYFITEDLREKELNISTLSPENLISLREDLIKLDERLITISIGSATVLTGSLRRSFINAFSSVRFQINNLIQNSFGT